jgi:hypothetical protein
VNVISQGVFSTNAPIVVASLKFFLTVADDDEEDKIAAEKEKAIFVSPSSLILLLFLFLSLLALTPLTGKIDRQKNELEAQREEDESWATRKSGKNSP